MHIVHFVYMDMTTYKWLIVLPQTKSLKLWTIHSLHSANDWRKSKI